MLCQDAMTPNPRTCVTTATLREAARIMGEDDVDFLPVVSPVNQVLVGIVTDHDLCSLVISGELLSPDAFLEEAMTMLPIVCRADDDVRICEELMQQHQLHRIPVVDELGRCIGIIEDADLFWIVAESGLFSKITDLREVQATARNVSAPPTKTAAA